MHQSLRTLPDLPLATVLTAAYGRAVTIEADPRGLWSAVCLPSGRRLVTAVASTPDLSVIQRVSVGSFVNAIDVDLLAALRLDLEILQVAGELVELYVGGALRPVHFEAALACAEAGSDEDEVTGYALQEARRLDLDLGDGEVPAPGACLVELALALHAVLLTGIEHASEVVDTTAVEVIDVR